MNSIKSKMRWSWLMLSLCMLSIAPTWAEEGFRHAQHFDGVHGNNHYYLNRGVTVRALPREARMVPYRGSRYWYHQGVWYRPYGHAFIAAAPPFGLYVPFLPAFATAVVIGGIPYYYANDTYYMYHQDVGQYEVVPSPEAANGPPANEPSGAGSADKIFVYPKNGQSAEQQADDKYECHRWAADQSGFDPTAGTASDASATADQRAQYQRAQQACLEGRGYTVR